MTTYILREFLLGIGNKNIVLYGEAARLYRCLREEKFFERLKKVEQLGVISQVEISASHTRWEYMIFQLYLIQKLFKEKGKRSLGDLKLGGMELSGVELLQLWVFIFNIGHLPGTFATMRGLLLAMEKDNELKKKLKKEVPDKLKEHFNEVIEERNIFELPKFLSAILLNDLKEEKRKNENDCSKVLNDFLFDLILCYISPDNCQDKREKIEELRLYFRMIRRLAYIFLDSKHVSSPISFDVSEIILNFENYKKLLMEPRSQLDKTLEACEDFLSITLYHSKDTISQLGRHAKETEEIFKEYEEKYPSFKDFLDEKSNKFHPKYYKPVLSFHVLLDLTQYEDGLEKDLSKFFYGLEKELNEKYFEKKQKNSNKRNKRVLLTYQPGSNKKHIAINFSIYKEEELWEPIEDFIFHIIEKIENEKGQFHFQLSELFKEQLYPPLLKFLLKLIFKRYLFKDIYFDNGQITASKSKTLKDDIREWIEKTKEKSVLNELEALEDVIKKEEMEKGYGIIGHNIKVKDQSIMEDIAEFDGIILFFKKNYSKINSEMLFLEAKRMQKGSESEGTEQLEEALKKVFKINKLPIKTGRISSKGRYAYCKVAINKEGFIRTDCNNHEGG